jgi:DNA-binding NarL/FixJ family response regulator
VDGDIITTSSDYGAHVSGNRVARLAKLLTEVWLEQAQACGLTPREAQVMRMALDGHSNKEIARLCEISELTVKDHLKHAFQKMGIRQRTQLLACLLRTGPNGRPQPDI